VVKAPSGPQRERAPVAPLTTRAFCLLKYQVTFKTALLTLAVQVPEPKKMKNWGKGMT
jgi:hypothetical protein